MGVIILGKNSNTLNEKKIAFQAEDQIEQKRVQSKLRKEVREAKKKNKEQIEFQFPTGNMRNAWKGLETLAGHSKPKLNTLNKPGDKQKVLSDELNDFYCWFDTHDFRSELAQIRSELQEKVADDVEDFETDAKFVEGIFLESITPAKQLVLTTCVEDFWNRAFPSFLLFSVSCSRSLWKKMLYALPGKPL